ncbi:MAG: VOC family protein [Hyphomicrobiales bacterium]|nr:VOC family protein [Hyphomicrobiales bacterium]
MTDESATPLPRALGFNHIALEVNDIDETLDFFGKVFPLKLRGRSDRMAFIDMGDQFLALSKGRSQGPDTERHFGLVVDDKDAVRARLEAIGAEILPGRGLDFLDPSGNRIQVVEYKNIQFTKTPEILESMGVTDAGKTENALDELRSKGVKV